VIEVAAIGLVAGILSGMLGVGGGVLFVPGLVFVAGLTQITAEATSLLAIIPVALVGAARQRRYGNLRLADGVLIGLLSVVGALGGVALANVLPGRVLRMLFALLILGAAYQLVRGARDGGPAPPAGVSDQVS
jgi:uncharacterized membrane protein YfcA